MYSFKSDSSFNLLVSDPGFWALNDGEQINGTSALIFEQSVSFKTYSNEDSLRSKLLSSTTMSSGDESGDDISTASDRVKALVASGFDLLLSGMEELTTYHINLLKEGSTSLKVFTKALNKWSVPGAIIANIIEGGTYQDVVFDLSKGAALSALATFGAKALLGATVVTGPVALLAFGAVAVYSIGEATGFIPDINLSDVIAAGQAIGNFSVEAWNSVTSTVQAGLTHFETGIRQAITSIEGAYAEGVAQGRQAAEDALASLGNLTDRAKELVRDSFSGVSEEFDRITDQVGEFADAIGLDSIVSGIGGFVDGVGEVVSRGVDAIGGLARDIRDTIADFLSDFDISDLPGWLRDLVLSRTESARTEASPLVLDMDGDGLISLINRDSDDAVYWDVDEDGIAELSGWVGSTDGLLAIDNNANGIIDDQSELFGSLSEDGFTVLARLDSNLDGIISAEDDDWSALRIWVDVNGDTVTDTGELQTLEEAGVASISLSSVEVDYFIAGNRVSHESTYLTLSGSSRDIVDAWFAFDDVNTGNRTGFDFVPSVIALPFLRGFGEQDDLWSAMSDDAELLQMVRDLTLSLSVVFDPEYDMESKFRDIMFRWAGVEDVLPDSRGRAVDGQELAYLEVITAKPFLQRGYPNPATEAGQTLTNAFSDAFDAILANFLIQTQGSALFGGTGEYDPIADSYSGLYELELAALQSLAASYEAENADMLAFWRPLVRVINQLTPFSEMSQADLDALNAIIAANDGNLGLDVEAIQLNIYGARSLSLNGTNGPDTLVGGSGSDNLSTGDGDDTLDGRAGNDSLSAGDGNDTLIGDVGNDTLFGGHGNDLYLYDSGWDTIRETSGTDTLHIRGNTILSDLSFEITGRDEVDLDIFIQGELSIRIENFFISGQAVETLTFETGGAYDLAQLAEGTVGTENAETLAGDQQAFFLNDRISGLGGDDTLQGGLGNDILLGGSGNDIMFGGDGQDRLQGADGADILDGGAGDDALFGGEGDDSYVYLSGDDVILDEGGIDVLRFEGGITASMITLSTVYTSQDLTVTVEGAGSILIQDFYANGSSIEGFVFGTDPSVTLSALGPIQIAGTGSTDYIRGDRSGQRADDILLGLDGSDRIYGYDGDDVLDGGAGIDRLFGGDGSDTYHVGQDADIISESGNIGEIDTLVLPEGITLADIQISRVPNGSAFLEWDGGSVLIDRGFSSLGQAVERLRLADGTEHDLLSLDFTTYGTDGADYISGSPFPFNINDRIEAGDGNDRIEAEEGDDVIDGGDGDDILEGGSGDDTLDGGAGNDTLRGGTGEDTYIVGDGNDFINDAGEAGEVDRIVFEGLNFSDVTYYRVADGDVVFEWTGGSVRIDNAFQSTNVVERLEFDDGQVVSLLTLRFETRGTDGNETIFGTPWPGQQSDTIFAFGGNDTVYGRNRDDLIFGGVGDDALYGEGGDDNLHGEAGNDSLYGGEGEDTYHVGEGHDYIADQGLAGEMDTVEFSIDFSDATFSLLSDRDLLVEWDGGSVRIDRAFEADYGVELFSFADGTRLTAASLELITNGDGANSTIEGTEWPGPRNNIIFAGGGNDTVLGLGGDDRLFGEAGRDTLRGGNGDDWLDGGSEDDRLEGGAGSDIYVIGEGTDTIRDTGLSGDVDIIQLDSQFTLETVEVYYLSNDQMVIASGGQRLALIENMSSTANGVEELHFADGRIIDLFAVNLTVGSDNSDYITTRNIIFDDVVQGFGGNDEIYTYGGDDRIVGGIGDDRLYAGDGDDVLVDGAGNDYMQGGSGNDRFVVSEGDNLIQDSGNTADTDTVFIDADVVAADLTYTFSADNSLTISWDGASVRLFRHYSDTRNRVETLELRDGTLIDLTSPSLPVATPPGGVVITGDSGAQTLTGGAGNDSLDGRAGNDVLISNGGDDYLEGGDGADTYQLSDGHHTIYDDGTVGEIDVIELPTGIVLADVSITRSGEDNILIDWGTGSVVIEFGFNRSSIETLRFSDGTEVAITERNFETFGSGADDNIDGADHNSNFLDDTIYGLDGADTLNGRDGNDALFGGLGEDSLFGGNGADELTGGNGNDSLHGGVGADIYYVGDGYDFISDDGNAGEVDQIVLRAGLTQADVDIYLNTSSDLVVAWADGHVIIDNFTNSADRVEELHFDDGTVITLLDFDFDIRGTGGAGRINGWDNGISRGDRIFGNAGEDVIYGRDGDDELHGGEDDDTLYGETGADQLFGGAGDDFMDGGSGADTYNVGDGHDTISDNGLQGETDTIVFADGIRYTDLNFVLVESNDLLVQWNNGSVFVVDAFATRSAIETLSFSDGLTVQLSGLNFESIGTDGDDSLAGFDSGLLVNDLVRGLSGNDRITLNAGDDIGFGDDGDDLIYGNDGDDDLYGGRGNDSLFGGNNSDLIVGGAGVDSLSGGGGSDLFAGTLAELDGDVITDFDYRRDGILIENANIDLSDITFTTGTNSALVAIDADGDGQEDIVLQLGTSLLSGFSLISRAVGGDTLISFSGADDVRTFSSTETILGNGLNNVFTGTARSSTIAGFIGDDFIDGGEGNDFLYGEFGDDQLIGGLGDDELYGGRDNDQLEGGSGQDSLFGGLGNDRLLGGADADILDGGLGSDTADYSRGSGGVIVNLTTGLGAISHAQGDTYISIENVVGTISRDLIIGSSDDNRIESGNGNDVVEGRDGDDSILAGDGDDSIIGGRGADYINGGAGFDVISYADSQASVSVLLSAGIGVNGDAEGDTLLNIESVIGSDHDDILVGRDGASDTLYGGDGFDGLRGNGGDDFLYGEAGDDFLFSGFGADHHDGGDGIDTVLYTAAGAGVIVNLTSGTGALGHAHGDSFVNVENIVGTAFSDLIIGSIGANTLQGRNGDDVLDGREGDDILLAGDGDDTILSGLGADMINGGNGVDTVDYALATTSVQVNLNAGVGLFGHAQGDSYVSVENVIGSAQQDYIVGNADANMIDGGAGNDTLEGRGGDDLLIGGAGHDTLRAGDGDDVMRGGQGNDTHDGGDGIDTIDYARSTAGIIVNLSSGTGLFGDADGDTFANIENIIGSSANDYLVGDAASNVIRGANGNDTLEGRDGSDTLNGGSGNDTLRGGNGHDTFISGFGSDVHEGGSGFDLVDYSEATAGVIVRLDLGQGYLGHAEGDTYSDIENVTGSAFGDFLVGDMNANIISGGAGNDTLNGREGADTLDGGSGDDSLLGGSGNDLMLSGTGADAHDGGAGADTVSYALAGAGVIVNLTAGTGMFGDAAGDSYINIENINGTAFGDYIVGSAGSNRLEGRAGNDVLEGREGADILVGGNNADRFVFGVGDGTDRIEDFSEAQGDIIDLRDFGFSSFAQVQALMFNSSGDAVINFGGGDAIRLVGINKDDLEADDFWLTNASPEVLSPEANGKSDLQAPVSRDLEEDLEVDFTGTPYEVEVISTHIDITYHELLEANDPRGLEKIAEMLLNDVWL